MKLTFPLALLLMSLLQYGAAFDFIASTNQLNFYGNPLFSVECSKTDILGEPNNMVAVVEIRVLKEVQGSWKTIAEINDRGDMITKVDRAKVNGYVNTVYDSYLNVTWDLAMHDVAGAYKCGVLGFTPDMHPVVYESNPVQITQQLAPNNQIPQNLRPYSQTHTNRMSNLVSFLKESVDDAKSKVDGAIDNVKTLFHSFIDLLRTNVHSELTDISSGQKQLISRYKEWEKNASEAQWPAGSYGLFSPESGCPDPVRGRPWKTGFRTHHTESDLTNPNNISVSAHMMRPIESDNVTVRRQVNQHFCTVDHVTGEGWPSGSYCINRKNGNCPPGFTSGDIYWDDYDGGPNYNYVGGYLPEMGLGSNTRIYYCCRNDSLPSSPIFLPISKPFYLYRYGPECQEIAGMSVTPEFLSFRTDCCSSSVRYPAPDNAISENGNRVTLHLCYYEAFTP